MCPGLKKRFRDSIYSHYLKLLVNMTKTDRRQVERKKAGLLKARKKWPYSRRWLLNSKKKLIMFYQLKRLNLSLTMVYFVGVVDSFALILSVNY